MCFFVQTNGAAPLNFEEFSLSAILESGLVILGLMFPSAFIVVGVQFITEFICENEKVGSDWHIYYCFFSFVHITCI